jgi:hypothetical protein
MKPEKESMIWIQLVRPIEVQKGDIVRFRVDHIWQYQPKNYHWTVTPLGKESDMIKLEIINPQPAKEGMILKILDIKETTKGRWTFKAELIEGLDPAAWDLINRAIQATKDQNV